jgi:hypothetical protein
MGTQEENKKFSGLMAFIGIIGILLIIIISIINK